MSRFHRQASAPPTDPSLEALRADPAHVRRVPERGERLSALSCARVLVLGSRVPFRIGTDEKGVTRVLGGNPETGPFYVETASPGDVLAVHNRNAGVVMRLPKDHLKTIPRKR